MLRTIGISCAISFCLLGARGHPLAEIKSHNGDGQQPRNISEKPELLTTEEPIQTSKEDSNIPAQTTQSLKSTPRLSLVYRPGRPTFAGQISTGLLSQLIPPGKPWPANVPSQSPTFVDRFGETTVMPTQTSSNPQPTTKSPLEYKPQKPSYAGVLSEGHLGQLIPSGESWPDKPTSKPQVININDRFKETTVKPFQELPTQVVTTKPSFDFQPQRPSFAGSPGGISGGHLGQLIPPGKPWPADPPNLNPTLEDRFKETTVAPVVTTKAPLSEGNSQLEYQPQRPTFAGSPGGISGGHLGQLIPPGKPWPADPPNLIPILEDRLQETPASQIVTTNKAPLSEENSPLYYQPQRPSFAGSPGGLSGGHLGQLIPPGKPWPADPPNLSPTLEDRFKETTVTPVVTTKPPLSEGSPPLDYQPQRPTFAGSPGGISGGNLGPLIPPGKPWPADPPNLIPILEDRLKETTASPIVTTNKAPLSEGNSPLDYQPQRPTFAGSPGGISGGHLGQLIPPGKPWPADPPNLIPILEDRLKETTASPIVTTNKAPLSEGNSPLDYQPQRPTFAGSPGGISGGHLGQLIPPGKPWPADPPIQRTLLKDQLKESTT